jgi:hypothetical protein
MCIGRFAFMLRWTRNGLTFVIMLLSISAFAFDAKCALCKKEIPAGKGVQAQIGNVRRNYRCIHCALSGLEKEKSTYTLIAKTPLDRKTVRLTHCAKGWTQEPATTVYLILPERAGECLDVHQPFATKTEYDRYLSSIRRSLPSIRSPTGSPTTKRCSRLEEGRRISFPQPLPFFSIYLYT